MGSNPTPPVSIRTHPHFLVEFEKWLTEGRVRKVTAKGYRKMIWLLSKIGDIDQPQKIEAIISTAQVSEGRKQLLANAYDYYVQFRGLTWDKPRFIREDVPIFLPLENELDALIANTRDKLSVFLQFLKETGVDPGEAWKLRWIDINPQRRTADITPTKNHNARTLPISENLLTRMLRLPRVNERVLANQNLDKFRFRYEQARNKLADKLGNPRIHEIAFKSFRHWKGTMEYYKTKDILHVKHVLGHKRIENTLKYTHLVNFESNEWISKVARTLDEACSLIEAGFDYVTDMEGVKIFRKRK